MPGAEKSLPSRSLSVRPLRPGDWSIIERLFGEKGACGGCWCMYWRVPRGGKQWQERLGDRNRRDFRRLVEAGKVYGCLAFSGDDPVGWCCLGPRGDFPRLERVKAIQTEWRETSWSVTCFFILPRWRRRGVGSALLREAVKLAKANGATELEGYPVISKWKPGADIPAAFAWTGVPRMFEKARFTSVTPPNHTRPIYRKRYR